jgi:hypothetical protein
MFASRCEARPSDERCKQPLRPTITASADLLLPCRLPPAPSAKKQIDLVERNLAFRRCNLLAIGARSVCADGIEIADKRLAPAR